MNKHRFHSEMEAAWELRPLTDITPESKAHSSRFQKQFKSQKNEDNIQNTSKTEPK